MVPFNRGSPNQQQHIQRPCFPGCLEWIMENQKVDGSWGLNNPNHPSLVKDSLSSTLACVLALQKWKVGEQLVQKGLDFIGSKRYAVMDKHQSSPIGFDIIFPGMINRANDLGLNLPLDSDFVNVMLSNRDLQLQRLRGKVAYFGEGLGESYEWKEVIKNKQRSNGSLFNSPATTAAALIQFHDDNCFGYLQSLLDIHGKAVPTIYPYDIYSRPCMVDTLDRLGIDRHLKHEIEIILDETHRCWQQRSEEIILDVACCALAFRLLRVNGYEVFSDALADFADEEHFFSTVSPQFTNTETIIHLHRASQIAIFQDEPILDKIKVWTSTFLKHHQYLSNQDIIYDEKLQKEVEYTLNFPFDTLDRLRHRRGTELYSPDDFRMLKTSYRCSNSYNRDLHIFSVQDFNKCQAIHAQEIKQLEKWVKDSRIMTLEFEWHILISSYFQIAAVHFEPEFSAVRIAWTQNSFVGTIIDDMFDVDGTEEELLNLVELLKRWDGHSDVVVGYCSERNEILFSAVQEIINEQAAKGFITQGRYIKHEIIEIWLNYFKCSFQEVEWRANNSTPTLDEYIKNGCQAIGIGLYSLNFYHLGPHLSKDLFESEEYYTLYRHAGIVGRVYNDYQGLETDKIQTKKNACFLLVSHGNGAITEEEAINEMRRMIESSKKEELRIMVEKKLCSIPKAFIKSFFKLYKICYYLYDDNDEYRRPGKTFDEINGLLYEPLVLPP